MMTQSAAIKYPVQISTDSRSFEEIIRELIERRFFSKTEQYEALGDWLDKRRKYKTCGTVSGKTGAGKSRASREYDAVATGRRGSLRRIKPLHSLYIRGFTSWGTRDFCREALKLFNHGARKGKPMDIRLRTWETFEEFGLELLLVDNAHILSEKLLFDLAECYDEFKIATVLVGPDKKLKDKLDSLGLFRKFGFHYEFEALSPRQVVEVLKDFKQSFLSLPKETVFFDGEIVHAICQASGGNPTKLDDPSCDFNTITNILVESIAQSSEDGVLRLDKHVLQEVLFNLGIDFEPTVKESSDVEPGITG